MTTTYQATVEREGRFWVITIPELDLVTQAHRVDQVEHMARDCIAVWLEVDYDDVAVDVTVQVPEAWRKEAESVHQAQTAVSTARSAAASQARASASRLRAQGLTVRDVAYLIGVSPQRVSQILH